MTDPIRLRYRWTEAEFAPFRDAMALFWAQSGAAAKQPAAPSAGWQWARYYLLPAALTVTGVSLWSRLLHGQWWPQSRLVTLDADVSAIMTGLFPGPALLALIVGASLYAMAELDRQMAARMPPPERREFDRVVGIDHEVILHDAGFDVAGPEMRGTNYWHLPDYGPVPVALSGRHVIVAHRLMLLVIPPDAMHQPPEALLARIVALRDAAPLSPSAPGSEALAEM